ncbi:hypothetical protein K402DRAFT_49950 [Aulographum hederae CBS 113979]|uniref:Uncharacterized protein n=1 Tax=Aulographum hederae CBS 113979 TaxID=1176131 RepID=A0A6G1H335_9PEZI|nr:hypothetical protein K402DRAFT_49950 [Aulographum hederae CBS 113979]
MSSSKINALQTRLTTTRGGKVRGYIPNGVCLIQIASPGSKAILVSNNVRARTLARFSNHAKDNLVIQIPKAPQSTNAATTLTLPEGASPAAVSMITNWMVVNEKADQPQQFLPANAMDMPFVHLALLYRTSLIFKPVMSNMNDLLRQTIMDKLDLTPVSSTKEWAELYKATESDEGMRRRLIHSTLDHLILTGRMSPELGMKINSWTDTIPGLSDEMHRLGTNKIEYRNRKMQATKPQVPKPRIPSGPSVISTASTRSALSVGSSQSKPSPQTSVTTSPSPSKVSYSAVLKSNPPSKGPSPAASLYKPTTVSKSPSPATAPSYSAVAMNKAVTRSPEIVVKLPKFGMASPVGNWADDVEEEANKCKEKAVVAEAKA